MNTTLSDIIKEGYDIQKGIYPDNGGGLYATFSFKDQNKYLKWAINATKFIESNFSKDEIYDRFKETLFLIEKELSIKEFNKLMFILESYNSSLQNNNNKFNSNQNRNIADMLIKYFAEDEMQKLTSILNEGRKVEDLKPFIDKLSPNQLKEIIFEMINSTYSKD
ncbi:MAG: hypothetical protein H6Q16_1451 [Bacteroidetes bacterium]|nr:hypothetical protein [Bacteroidota bacterium]